MRSRYPLLAVVFAAVLSVPSPGRAYDALEACRSQSLLTDDIHDCMDNYLALIDENLNDLTVYIDGQMRGLERAAFSRAQNSFYTYRRENCLWYLEIGGSRVQAEQIAKNCLSDMSQNRLAELQALIADYENEDISRAFGADSNLVTSLAGIDTAEVNSTASEEPDSATSEPAELPDASAGAEDQGLSAYLGAWQVTCTNTRARRCFTDVPLEEVDGEASGAIMRIGYRSDNRASVELVFPNEQPDTTEQLVWRVDNYTFGSVPGSLISVDDEAARQIINEVKFVRDELIPLFQSGTTVRITLLEKANGSAGKDFEATLVGFSRARSFANDYINGELP